MNREQTILLLLGLSLLFFLRKGIQYAVLGSYAPLGFVLLFTLLLGFSLNSSPRIFYLSAPIIRSAPPRHGACVDHPMCGATS